MIQLYYINHLNVTFKCRSRITYKCYSRTIFIYGLTMPKKSVKLYTDNVIENFYAAVSNNSLHKLHIPHSDVFYVRAAVEAHYGRKFTLKHVEEAMRAEGWTEGGHDVEEDR